MRGDAQLIDRSRPMLQLDPIGAFLVPKTRSNVRSDRGDAYDIKREREVVMIRKRCVTAAVAIASLWLGSAAFASTITVVIGGGALGDGQIKALAEPFEKLTGNKVIAVKDQFSFAQLKLGEETKTQNVDVISVTGAEGIIASRLGYIQNIDYTRFSQEDV
jgi:spermidine/putrescine-binding protein